MIDKYISIHIVFTGTCRLNPCTPDISYQIHNRLLVRIQIPLLLYSFEVFFKNIKFWFGKVPVF